MFVIKVSKCCKKEGGEGFEPPYEDLQSPT